MDDRFVLSYDLGTSGVKAAIVRIDGSLVGTATAIYPLYVPKDGWAEQDPKEYWEGVCTASKSVLLNYGVDPHKAVGIVFGTQWKGIIPISSDGKVLHRSIIWLDARAGDQARRLNERFGKDLYCDSDYWPKLMWLNENEPEIVRQASVILEANSYLKWKATGKYKMDISNCFVRSFDNAIEKRYIDILDFIDIPRNKFPEWTRCDKEIGHVTAEAALQLGIKDNVPVFAGCSDIPGIAIGSGSSKQGAAHAYFGSSGWIGYCVPHGEEAPYISPFDFDRDISTPMGLQAAGLSLKWVAEKLYTKESQKGDAVYDLINREVAQIPCGSDGVFATPWFYGEVKPFFGPDARGNFLNIGPNHDRRHMARAMMEGVCYMMKISERYCVEKLNLPDASTINVVGGGACSGVWMQMLADVLDKTVCVPYQPRHAGALGIASCALVGLGEYKDFSKVGEKLRIESRFIPRPSTVDCYHKGYEVFTQLYQILKPVFAEINNSKNLEKDLLL